MDWKWVFKAGCEEVKTDPVDTIPLVKLNYIACSSSYLSHSLLSVIYPIGCFIWEEYTENRCWLFFQFDKMLNHLCTASLFLKWYVKVVCVLQAPTVAVSPFSCLCFTSTCPVAQVKRNGVGGNTLLTDRLRRAQSDSVEKIWSLLWVQLFKETAENKKNY